jgi:hypothetical protein
VCSKTFFISGLLTDCFVGYYLNVSLTIVKTFHSHLEGLPLIRTAQLSDQVRVNKDKLVLSCGKVCKQGMIALTNACNRWQHFPIAGLLNLWSAMVESFYFIFGLL